MFFDVVRFATGPTRLAPVDSRLAPLFCVVLLTISCVLASFAFACATPFAAFAVIASAMLSMPAALFAVSAAWIINQTIGFSVLGYPRNTNTFLWGLAIGVAVLLATASAKMALRAWPRADSAVALASSIVAAYASYEIALLAFTPVLGGAGAFTAKIVMRLGLLNVLWLVGLAAICQLLRHGTTLWQRRLAH